MNRKIFISVLGTGFYEECKYTKDTFISTPTRYIQEATLEYLHTKDWNANDKIIILLTDKAKITNWQVENQTRNKPGNSTPTPYIGLEQILRNKHYPCKIEELSIADGKNEKEMWSIFETLYSSLQENDELYIDLTHSFRYLPMLVLVMCNFASFMKHIHVSSVTYGYFENNYEHKPIIELSSLFSLQEWTFAGASLKTMGKMAQLTQSIKQEQKNISKSNRKERSINEDITQLHKQINEFEAQLNTCRGKLILKGDAAQKIKNTINSALKSDLPNPIKQILFEVISLISPFQANNINNIKEAIHWCIRFQMVQQAYTLTQEGIITILCENFADINPFKGENRKREYRDYINSILSVSDNIAQDEEKWSYAFSNNRALTNGFLSLAWVKELRLQYAKLVKNRNQINHGGFLGDESTKTLIEQLQSTVCDCFNVIDQKLESPHIIVPDTPILINLSNHPYEKWNTIQKEAAQIYGTCIDIPFPQIEAEADEKRIQELIQQYFNQIINYSSQYIVTVHIMGEMTFVYNLIYKLKKSGICCIASTANRDVNEIDETRKQVNFKFIRFRKY